MKYLLINCLMIFLISCNAKSQEEKLILNFISACKDESIEIATIKEKYICENRKNTEANAALDQYIENRISSIRKEIQSKDLSKLKILNATKYKEIQEEFLINDFSKIFILKENQKILFYFLIENDKIMAFNFLNKGGTKIFIALCN